MRVGAGVCVLVRVAVGLVVTVALGERVEVVKVVGLAVGVALGDGMATVASAVAEGTPVGASVGKGAGILAQAARRRGSAASHQRADEIICCKISGRGTFVNQAPQTILSTCHVLLTL